MKFFIIIHKVKRIVDNLLPLPIRRVARKLYRWFAEKLVFLIYSRDELWFPPWLDSDTNTINKLVGDKLVSFLVEFAGLKANEKILEVGCGFGRIAAPLTKYLTSAGTYEGFDIIEDHINWCKEKITMKFPNFNFKLVDLHNENYNPSGTFRATDFRFPYDDGYFDFVILNSVFTIMDPQDMSPYASEIVRVLRKGGRCTATFFLLTDESTEFIDKNLSICSVICTYTKALLRYLNACLTSFKVIDALPSNSPDSLFLITLDISSPFFCPLEMKV